MQSVVHVDDTDVLRHYRLDEFRADEWVEVEDDKLPTQVTTAAQEERDADPLGIKKSIFEPDRRLSRHSRRSILLSETEKETVCRVGFNSFDAKVFMRDIHRGTTYSEFCRGAEHLRQQLERRSEGMRDLVRQHFDHFVNAKNAIDDVHFAMDNNGLTADTDYGVAGFQERARVSLDYTETLFGPILERRGRTEMLRTAQTIVDKHKFFFSLPSSLTECAKQRKYDLAVRNYKKGRHLMRALIGKAAKAESGESSEEDISSIPEHNVDFLDVFGLQLNKTTGEEYTLHLDLDSGEDPGWHYLQARHKWGCNLLKESFDKFADRMNDLYKERQAAGQPSTSADPGAAIFRVATLRKALDVREKALPDLFNKERDGIAWELVASVVNSLCDVLHRCLPTFWLVIKKYADGAYSNKPVVDKKEVRKSIAARLKKAAGHLKKADEAHKMAAELTQLFAQLIGRMLGIQDAASTSSSSSSKSRGTDAITIRLPPSHTLILGHFLSRCVERVVDCRRQLATATKSSEVNTGAAGEGIIMAMRAIERKMREKSIRLLCESWISDAQVFYLHEDWQPHPKHSEVTMQVRLVYRLHKRTLHMIGTLMGVSSRSNVNWDKDSQMPVSARTLNVACNGFLQAILAWLDCLNHLASNVKLDNDRRVQSICTKRYLTIDIRDFRSLTAGANLYRFHKIKLPKLARLAERCMAAAVTEEIDSLIQMSSRLRDRLVDQYSSRKSIPILRELRNGLLMDGYDWVARQPTEEIRPFIRRVLLAIVLMHAEVHALAPVLERRTLTTVQDQLALEWLADHRELDHVGLSGFVQSMLETYFIQKTLGLYCSEVAENQYRLVQTTLEQAFRRHTSSDNGGDPTERKQLRPAMEAMQQHLVACRRACMVEFSCFRSQQSSHRRHSQGSHASGGSFGPSSQNYSGHGSSGRSNGRQRTSQTPLPPPKPPARKRSNGSNPSAISYSEEQ
ncbi:exocyst complex component Sec5-domain-containing protein [Syncephalis fuscata]|nr:exocyst complex component Sec5-domain-containing protein [Syncephalis fuscata]